LSRKTSRGRSKRRCLSDIRGCLRNEECGGPSELSSK
jgi:hypothetical protein